MRVLMHARNYPPAYGGGGRQARSLARALVQRGHEVTVLARTLEGVPNRYTEEDVEVIRGGALTDQSGALTKAISTLGVMSSVRTCGREANIFHLHGPKVEGAAALWQARRMGLGTLVKLTMLGSDDPLALRGHVASLCFRWSDAIVATSTALEQACLGAGIPRQAVWRIPNGVDLERFRPPDDQSEIRERLDLPRSAFIGVFAGSLVCRRKRVSFLIRAWAKAFGGDRDCVLLLVGPTEPKDDVETRVHVEVMRALEETGIQDQVRMAGYTDDPERYLQAADVLVFASRQEGQPNAVLEAMAVGLPTVVCEIPDITDDIVFDEDNGRCVAPDDLDGFARALVELREDEEGRCAMGRRAQAMVEKEFGLSHVSQQYGELYESISK